MGNKDTNLIALNKSLKTPANVEEFAGVLINNGVLDKPALKAVDVKAKSEFFKQFMACAFSSKDAEKKDAIVLGKFHFLKKSKAKSDIDMFVASASSVAQELKTHATQNPDDKQSAKKSAFFCGVLESVGAKVEATPGEQPGPPPEQQQEQQQDSGGEKAKLEKQLKALGDKVKLAKGLSDIGKKASDKYDEAMSLLEGDDLTAIKLAISEVNTFLRKSDKVVEVVERVNDLKAEVDQVLKNNPASEVGLQAKAKLDEAGKGLKGEDPKLDQIGAQLSEVDTLLENNDEDDGEPLISIKELKTLLTKAAKADGSESYPFACCEAADGFTFIMHKRKKASALMKNLKREKSSSKLKYGTITVDKKAKAAILTVEGEVGAIPTIFKLMKLWLKENKPLPVKKARIIIGGSEVVPSSDEIVELLKDYAARVLTVKSNNPMFSSEVDNVWNTVLEKAGAAPDFADLSDDNVSEVTGLLGNVDAILDQLEGAKDWLPVSKEVGELYTTAFNLLGDNKPDYWGKLTAAWTKAREEAESYNFDNAHTIADKVKSTLLGIVEGSLTGDDDAQTRWEKASSNWSKTISTVVEQIKVLKQELMKLNDDGLKEIAQFELDDLFLDYVNRITKAFNNVSKLSGSPEKQANLAGDALDVIVEFKNHMRSNEKIKVVERFGASAFDAPVSAQGPLTEAFNELQPALVLLKGVAAT